MGWDDGQTVERGGDTEKDLLEHNEYWWHIRAAARAAKK